jgi:hypothetical protein
MRDPVHTTECEVIYTHARILQEVPQVDVSLRLMKELHQLAWDLVLLWLLGCYMRRI